MDQELALQEIHPQQVHHKEIKVAIIQELHLIMDQVVAVEPVLQEETVLQIPLGQEV